MGVKVFILCLVWFAFGIYTGIKIWNHFFSIRIEIEGKDITDEEIDAIAQKIRDRIED